MKYIILSLILSLNMATSFAWEPKPNQIIDNALHQEIAEILKNELVIRSIEIQNEHHKDLSNSEIKELDQTWRAQTKLENQPLISSLLNRPLSAYLTRIQAHSKGLFTEMFVMDNKGLNVGQSAMSSDFWQGDEAKWQKTYLKSANQKFLDEAEFDKDRKIWMMQYNIAITDNDGNNIGAATIELNLSELARQKGLLSLTSTEKKALINE